MMYPIQWVNSLEPSNESVLMNLASRLSRFYEARMDYYDYMEALGQWTYAGYVPCEEIISLSKEATRICEVGCGNSDILAVKRELAEKYTGLEFSADVLSKNKEKYPEATFVQIVDPNAYNLPSGQFDLVFSMFVIEHVIFPQHFLNECIRLLKPGGKLVVFGPNFLDYGWAASQRVASSLGSGTQLFKKGKLLDAFTSSLYHRLLIPRETRRLAGHRGFFINVDPACFHHTGVQPDLDACHITSFQFISTFLREAGLTISENSDRLQEFLKVRRLGYLLAQK